MAERTFWPLGVVPSVRILRWTITVLAIGFISVSSMVNWVDDPGTAYDESEIQLNLATPVSLSDISIQLIEHDSRASSILRGYRRSWNESRTLFAFRVMHSTNASHSLRTLLCSLLC